ncbi:MAG: alpha/beta hydrolase [Spirochaetes bacterium]|nr:alpha/beta hydrolase [Spirochaetota bacterium]
MKNFKIVDTQYGKISYIDIGAKDSEVILFSTGGGVGIDSVYAFDWLIKEGFRVIAINRPGYFDLNVDTVDTIEGHADIYYEVIKYLGIKEVNVFGISMGGLSALYYAQKYPIKSLVLWSAVSGKYQANEDAVNSSLGKIVMTKHGKKIISWMLLASAKLFPVVTIKSFLKTEADLNKTEINKIAKQIVQKPSGKRNFIIFVQSMIPMDALYTGMMDEVEKAKQPSSIIWKKITCPTFAVYSTVDKDVSKEHAERLEENLKDIKVKYVRAAGHFVWWGDEGEEVIRETIAFFKSKS